MNAKELNQKLVELQEALCQFHGALFDSDLSEETKHKVWENSYAAGRLITCASASLFCDELRSEQPLPGKIGLRL